MRLSDMMPSPPRHLLAACALAASTSLTGCGATLVPFTQELRAEHQLAREDVEQLQFYVSHTVKLRREVERRARRIERGHLELRSGKTIEEVVIEKETPGVAVAVSDDAIRVSFQEGTALSFGLQAGESYPEPQAPPSLGRFAQPPDPFPGDRPLSSSVVSPNSIGGSYFLQTDAEGSRLAFHGKWWHPVDDSSLAHLMIDTEQLEDVVESHTVLEGRTIGSRRGHRQATHSRAVPLLMF